ncbi:NnrS family protein [Microvirga sp. W0021]|uniref:NnrS family protein n=1 Tax=Hohaiivirga grylli TaxID=3133970 RepID=A0ABV0BK47_9HYPH
MPIATKKPTRRNTPDGIPFLSYGFRPFFFLGSIQAAFIVLFWIPIFYGHITSFSALPALEWHIHELLYGYLSAAVVGFLLTAVPNWTGRLPVSGPPLGALVALWLAGRFFISASEFTGLTFAAIIDASFLFVVIGVIAREIIAGKNYRNLRVLAGVILLMIGNTCFLFEVITKGYANYGIRIGIAAMLMLVVLIGGRIIPSFTRNWLVQNNPGRIPIPFNRFDGATILISGIALSCWIFWPQNQICGALFILAGIMQFGRLIRWAGDRTLANPLLAILHVAYLFIPFGFILESLAIYELVATSAGIHAWTSGAFALMTLAVMSRASLGHTGRALKATVIMQVIYILAVFAAVTRVYATLIAANQIWVYLSGTLWVLAFLGFAIYYTPIFWGPKQR